MTKVIEPIHDNLARRLLRDPALQTARLTPARKVEDDTEANVSTSIKVIESASLIFDRLQIKITDLEETNYNLNSEILQLTIQKEESFNQLVSAEQAIRSAEERANRAEAQLAAVSSRAKHLEQHNEALTAQLNRMLQAVTRSLTTKIEEEQTTDRSLKVV